ncbi:MAG TPA: toll/interleukin-1 receptor domain-containing protein, partial [Longimicrobium sp.]|nr:toll/interleukin-1 receptor domain-containing protein [Longimicrobium sp.]
EAEPGEVRLGEETDCRWAVGARVTVRCAVRGLDVPAQTQSFTWDGECRTVSFDIEIPQNAKPRDTVIVMEAFVHGNEDAPDAVQVGRLRMTLEIGDDGDDGEPQKVKGEAARTAFASYASADRLDVLERASSIRRSAGIEVKVDVLFLEMGERWNEELLKEIEACDKLMLFWSEHTPKSKWVEWEWKHAVEKKGEDVLELHLLRHTPIDQVPEELRKYHFNDVYLLARDAELYRREQAAKAAAASTPDAAG